MLGPDRGRKVTYTHPRRWLPGFRPADGDAALRTLAMRYLCAYGPATPPQHFAKWLSIPPRYAAGLFGKLTGELKRVDSDGALGWTIAGDTKTPPGRITGYACCLTSTPTLSRVNHGNGYTRPRPPPALTPAAQAGNYPVLLVGGMVGGVWHQRRSGRKLAITVEPLRKLTPRNSLDSRCENAPA